jgi:2-succinyl-5-enolpyruvyl-6-hydroxy-3-cyclohexene-1-carboxylate synthase
MPDPTSAPAAPRPEGHWSDWVALITAVLAVVTAFASAQASKLSGQTLLLENQATDRWAYYQAKSVKGHTYQLESELVELMEPSASPDLQARRKAAHDRWVSEAERFDKEKKAVEKEAQDFENQRKRVDVRGDREAQSVIALQIAIVLSSVAGITKKRWLLGLGLSAGAVGTLLFVHGVLS